MAVRAVLARFQVPRDIARFGFNRYGERTALITDDLTLSYRDLERLVLGLVAAWQAEGIRKGTPVLSVLPDGIAQIVVRLAANEAGVLLTAFGAQASADQLGVAVQTVPPRLVIAHPLTLDDAVEVADGVPVWTVGEEFDARIARSDPARSAEDVAPGDPLGIGYTSGTTGTPKAVVSAQGKLVTSMRLVVRNVGVPAPGERPDVFVVAIPLTGAGGGTLMPALLAGSALVLPPDYAAGTIAERIETLRATRTFVTPSTLIDLLDLPGTADLSSLSSVIYGSEQTPGAKVREALDRFGPILQQGYGSSEVLPPLTMLQQRDHLIDGRPAPAEQLTSVGRVVKGVQVKVVSDAGAALQAGEIGQILVKSPTVFDGYLDRPDLTAQVLHEGWFRIGDVGRFLPDERLQVLGRTADVMQRDGRPVYPRFVEEAAHRHPGVKETAYVQVGDRLVLACSLRANVDEAAAQAFAPTLEAFLAALVPGEDLPDDVVVHRGDLPRSPLTKVLRREIRQLLEQSRA